MANGNYPFLEELERRLGWRTALGAVSTPFTAWYETIAKPFAATVARPWTKDLPLRAREPEGVTMPFAREPWMRQYEQWQAPQFRTGRYMPELLGGEEITLGVKGGLETIGELPLWLAMGKPGRTPIKRMYGLYDKALAKQTAGKALSKVEQQVLKKVPEFEKAISGKYPVKPAPTPAMGVARMPTIEELITANYEPRAAATIGQKLTKIPGVIGSLNKRLLPMQAVKTDAEKAVIAWMGQKDIAPSLARIEMDAIYAKDFPFKFAPPLYPKGKLPIKPIKEGLVKNVKPLKPEYEPHIMAIAEFPERYTLTATQQAELDALDIILKRQLARELAVGVKVKPVKLAPGQRYVPRFVQEIKDLETEAITEIKRGVSTRPGALPSSFKERYYEEVLDGMLKGKVYSADLRVAVETRLAAGNKAISDKMLADYLAPMGRLPKETIKLELAIAKREIVERRLALKQISEIIEHINARRPIDWHRWLGVKKSYPAQYAELRAISKTGGKIPSELRRFIVDEKKALTATSKEVTTKYATELRRARRPILGKEGTINHAGLQGRLFPIDIAEPTNALIRGEITVHQVLGEIARVNAVARMGQTAIDTGFMLIQLLMTLANYPGQWTQAFVQCMKTLVNPKYTAKFNAIPKHAVTRVKIATHGGATFGGTEFTEAARAGGWLEKIPLLGKGFRRFGRAFEDALDTARTLIVEAREPHFVRKLGRPLTDAELTDLVVTVDHMVGISSLRRLGVDGFTRNLGSNVLYAPRYYVAFVSFLARAFQGGIGGEIAREGLAKLLVAMPIAMTAIAYALGQEERVIPTKEKPIPVMFDPRTGEFMNVEVAGTHMGLGGVWVAGFRLLGSLIRTAQDNPENFLSIDPHENPILRYGYGRGSPLASAAIDIATGQNYLGERLDTPDDYLDELVDKTFPFWGAGLITDVPKAGWEKSVAEWWGLRAWMVQYREEARDYAESHIKDFPPEMIMPWQREKIEGGAPLIYDDLNNEQRAWLLLNFEDYREAEEKRRGRATETGTDFQVADIKTREILDTAYQTDLEEVAEGVFGGLNDIQDYQDQAEYLRRIRQGEWQYRETIKMFLDEERWEDIEKWIEENQKPEDVAYDRYMELRGNPPKTAGKPDWDKWKIIIDEYLKIIDPETRAYIERRQDDWISNLPPNARKLELLIQTCEDVLDDYYSQPEGKARAMYREANPIVDVKLNLLGRATTVRTNEALKDLRRWIIAWELPLEIFPALQKELEIWQPPRTGISGGVKNPFR